MSCLSIEQLDDGDIILRKVVSFNPSNKQGYLDLFEDNIKKGIIKNDTKFFDDTWVLILGNIEYRITFFNDIQLKKCSKLFGISVKDFELAYRSFILFNLYKARTIIHFAGYFKTLLNKGTLTKNCASKVVSITNALLQYITIPSQNVDFFNCILSEDFSDVESNSAEIPDFKDIFLISDIVNDIIKNKKISNYKEHLLFILWWKICSTLPLRPSEFLATKFSCIYEEDDKFYLNVFRSKGKAGELILNIAKKEDYYEEDTIRIDYDLFELIRTYQEILVTDFEYKEKKDLFPFDLIKNGRGYKANKREINTSSLVSKDMIYAIERFYKSVITKEYGFVTVFRYEKNKPNVPYIENINPKDLRHIAIINLVLMGCDVLDVMRLAGHSKVNTAMGYYNHVKEFSKGYALGYMNSFKNKEKIKEKDFETYSKTTSDKVRKNESKEEFNQIMNIIKGDKPKVFPVDGGTCHYSSLDEDLSNCWLYEGNHTICPYFVENNKSVLQKELENVENKIDSNIRMLKDLIHDMKKISKFNELYQSTSFELAQNILDMANLNKKILEEE